MLILLSEDLSASILRQRVIEAASARKKCILIVPEQETLNAEAQMAEALPQDAPVFFEVTNFSRLANTVFRAKGGISFRYADKASSALLMWKVLDAAAPLLSLGDNITDSAHVKEMLAALNEFYASGVGADALEEAARQLPEEDQLRKRVSDLALIFRLYKGELTLTYGNHAEDLDRLSAVLKEEPFFKDTIFFVDNFTSFTAQEYRVLGELIRTTEVTVALSSAPDDCHSLCYEETRDTEKRLIALAQTANAKIKTEVHLQRAFPPAIEHAVRELFRADKQEAVFEKENKDLTLWCEETPFSASMRIASDIADRVRKGTRYRDFVIFARGTQNYRGILDAALEKQGLPFFMSEEKDVFSFAAVKMITTAYTVLTRGYRKEDIIAFLKCGFGGFSTDDIDTFELYADFWHIGGKLFRKPNDFTMNPDGYKDTLSENEEQVLLRVNRVHRELLRLFGILEEGTEGEISVTEHLTTLYTFLREIQCEERLRALAQAAYERGESAYAEMLERLFGAICELFDRAHEAIGDLTVSKERFADILALLFSTVGLGQLPTSKDVITVGNAEMLRASGTRYVYLLGANEGEFPANVRVGGAFEDNERRILSDLGLPLAFDPVIRASREHFCFLRALSAASEHVTVVSYEKNASGEAVSPSSVFKRLTAMFGAPALRGGIEPYHPKAALYMLGELADTPQKKALKKLLGDKENYIHHFDGTSIPLSDTDCRLSPELSKRIFDEDMYMSQTRLDAYVDCPFSYYCKNVLKLGENKDSAFGFSDIGTLIHTLLERLFLKLSHLKKNIRTVKKTELSALVETLTREYIADICPEEMTDAPRLDHLFKRLRRTVELLAEEIYDEFKQSQFSPDFFEFPIGEEGSPEPVVFATEDGGRMIFHGKIDRVDTYRTKDGKLYLRVIDYKTGTKVFSLSDVERGKNLQLLIYLISLWKSHDKKFLDKLGIGENESPLPAGMLYMSASPKDVKFPAPASAEEIRDKAKENLAVNGLVLEDEEIVRAMDATLSGRYAPSPLDRYGKMTWGKSFATIEKLEGLLSGMKNTVGHIGTMMRQGVANAEPFVLKADKSPCEYCSYFPVCRKAST